MTEGLLLVGSFLMAVSGIGIVVMPDIFCRLHALAKALVLGITLLLLALIFDFSTFSTSIKGLLALFFQFATIPLSGQIFALYASKK